jgi:hypothetical protein
MRAACQAAKISPPINFHGLRHTWASLTTMNGAPLVIRGAAPRFGIATGDTVTPLQKRPQKRA